MFTRVRLAKSGILLPGFRRYASNSHHHEQPSKSFEINLTKVFAIAGIAGGFLVWKNHSRTEKPLLETELYKFQESGERTSKRNESYLQKYQTSFIKEFIRDKGGIGQRQYRKLSDGTPISSSLINSHSVFRTEFGAGIKTDQLGPRKERIRIYAPIRD